MLLLRRIGVMSAFGTVGMVGAAIHAWSQLGANVLDATTWRWVSAMALNGDFRAAAAMGTIMVVWTVGTVFVGTLAAGLLVRPKEDYGRAEWGSLGEARKAELLAKTGFILGRLGWFRTRLLRQKLLATLVIGPARTGKSVSVIIPSILALGRQSAFIHDLKGELAVATATAREKVGKVYVVNPRSEHSAKWNPISRKELPANPSDMGDAIDNYWLFLIPSTPGTAESGASRHFTDGGRVFGAAATLLTIYRCAEQGKDATLNDVLKWLTGMLDPEPPPAAPPVSAPTAGKAKGKGKGKGQGSGQTPAEAGPIDFVSERITTAIDEVRAKGWPERIAIGLARVLQAAKEERSSLVSTAAGGLTPWLNEKIAAVSSDCTFSVRDYRGADPITVFWKCPPMDAKTYGPLTGMHVEALVRFLTLEYRAGLPQVSMIIDEAAFLPALQVVAEAPAIVLGYGVRLLVAVQDVAQLVLKYGQQRYDAMIGNYGQRVVFPSNNPKTAKEISEMIGKSTRLVHTDSGRGLKLHERNDSVRAEGKALIEPSELMSMPRGKVLVLTQYRTQRPILATAAYYKKIGRFRRMADKKLSPSIRAALEG